MGVSEVLLYGCSPASADAAIAELRKLDGQSVSELVLARAGDGTDLVVTGGAQEWYFVALYWGPEHESSASAVAIAPPSGEDVPDRMVVGGELVLVEPRYLLDRKTVTELIEALYAGKDLSAASLCRWE